MSDRLTAARGFLAGNARLLDRRRSELFFEGGDAAPVLAALGAHRNADGGFGHGLDPDLRSPASQPAAAWHASRSSPTSHPPSRQRRRSSATGSRPSRHRTAGFRSPSRSPTPVGARPSGPRPIRRRFRCRSRTSSPPTTIASAGTTLPSPAIRGSSGRRRAAWRGSPGSRLLPRRTCSASASGCAGPRSRARATSPGPSSTSPSSQPTSSGSRTSRGTTAAGRSTSGATRRPRRSSGAATRPCGRSPSCAATGGSSAQRTATGVPMSTKR